MGTLDPNNFDECLHGAIRKIDHAARLAELVKQMCLVAAKGNQDCALDYEQLNDRKEHVWRLRESVECDPQLPMLFGDAVHNYRTALDHLAWSLVKLAGLKPGNKTFFPVEEVEPLDGGQKSPIDDRIDAKNPINTYVQSVQPFVTDLADGYLAPIAQLHRLDLADKHRVLLVSAVNVDYAYFVSTDPEIRMNLISYGGSIAAGSVVMRAHTAKPTDLPEGKARLIVRLEDVHYRVDKKGNEIMTPLPYRVDVIDFLNSVHPEVSKIVQGANALFESPHTHTGSGEISHFERYADGTWQSI